MIITRTLGAFGVAALLAMAAAPAAQAGMHQNEADNHDAEMAAQMSKRPMMHQRMMMRHRMMHHRTMHRRMMHRDM